MTSDVHKTTLKRQTAHYKQLQNDHRKETTKDKSSTNELCSQTNEHKMIKKKRKKKKLKMTQRNKNTCEITAERHSIKQTVEARRPRHRLWRIHAHNTQKDYITPKTTIGVWRKNKTKHKNTMKTFDWSNFSSFFSLKLLMLGIHPAAAVSSPDVQQLFPDCHVFPRALLPVKTAVV